MGKKAALKMAHCRDLFPFYKNIQYFYLNQEFPTAGGDDDDEDAKELQERQRQHKFQGLGTPLPRKSQTSFIVGLLG